MFYDNWGFMGAAKPTYNLALEGMKALGACNNIIAWKSKTTI